MDKTFSMADFTESEKKLAIDYIEKALIGYITATGKYQAEKLFEKLKRARFYTDDQFQLTFTVTTIGNDLLAAVGAARVELNKKGER